MSALSCIYLCVCVCEPGLAGMSVLTDIVLVPMRHLNRGQLLLCLVSVHQSAGTVLSHTSTLFTHTYAHRHTSFWLVFSVLVCGLFTSIHSSLTPPLSRLQHCISHETTLLVTNLYCCCSAPLSWLYLGWQPSSAAGPKAPALSSRRLTVSSQLKTTWHGLLMIFNNTCLCECSPSLWLQRLVYCSWISEYYSLLQQNIFVNSFGGGVKLEWSKVGKRISFIFLPTPLSSSPLV